MLWKQLTHVFMHFSDFIHFLQMRGTGALVVAAMLDFLTFALCAPYSETTEGKQFDVLLEKVADRGRTLFRLFQQPSHTIVKVNEVPETPIFNL